MLIAEFQDDFAGGEEGGKVIVIHGCSDLSGLSAIECRLKVN